MKLSTIKCCGQPMAVNIETPMYYEVQCKKCGDVIVIKKSKNMKPVMLDD